MEQTITQLREELINYFCHLLPKSVSITYDEKEIDKMIQEHFDSIPVEKPVILPKPNSTVCKLQSLMVEADAIRTEIQGMETFNDERVRQGNSVGYSQEHFTEMAEQLRCVAKQMKELANTCEA